MAFALALSRTSLGMATVALLLTLAAPRPARRPTPDRRMTLALATFALGIAIFALFFGLVAACDWM